MALTPKNQLTRQDKRAQQDNAQQEALMREVDDAVRQGDALRGALGLCRGLVLLDVRQGLEPGERGGEKKGRSSARVK